jgi:hypothetical protein
VHQGDTGGGDGGGKPQVGPLRRHSLILDLGLGFRGEFLVPFLIRFENEISFSQNKIYYLARLWYH